MKSGIYSENRTTF